MLKHAEEMEWRISGIPQNTERFLSLTIGPFRFLDSLHFLKGSLSQLVDNAMGGGHDFPLLGDFKWKKLQGSLHRDLIMKKGIYPYRIAITASQLRSLKELPSQSHFYSDLTEQEVRQSDYDFAQTFWSVSGCENMLDYTEAYCMIDVLLLASCVELYREKVYSEFKLDCSQFLSGPHLAYSAMLLLKDQRVDLLTDIDMYNMLERGLRGGVCHAALRHATVPTEGSNDTLIMLDAVNLYGWSLCQELPAHSFEWLEEDELESIDWLNAGSEAMAHTDENGESTGYIAEVDLEYPDELHRSHSSFPLAPEHFDITDDMLSPYARHCRDVLTSGEGECRVPKFRKETKLAATFRDREKYVVHYKCLSLYLRLGMKLKKVRRVMRFKQSSWIRGYVERMTKKRREASSKFEQQLFKDFVNHIFGKCIQDLRKQSVCLFCTCEQDFEEAQRTNFFTSYKIVDDESAIFYTKKKEIVMDRPYFAGFAVLELAKYKMYTLFYDSIKSKFPTCDVTCCFTDTDSLMIYAPGVKKINFLTTLKGCMDFSNYPPDNELYSTANKMAPGYLKDETCGKQVTELCALKSKCYAFKVADDAGTLNAKCKGAKKSIVKRDMRLDMYKSCLSSVNSLRIASSRLQSKDYNMYLLRTRKVALSSYESKRYLWPCGVHSHPYYSSHIKAGQQDCPYCGFTVAQMEERFLLYRP